MKKIFILFCTSVLMLTLSVFAADTTTDWTNATSVNRVNTIGKNLLSKNNLPTN